MRPPRIWRYVVRYDADFAPHISDGICSLAGCKPKIRRYAARDDWIIGFAPATVARGRAVVKYAMIVTEEPMPFAQYWRRHSGRRDAIYKPVGDRLEWVENGFNDHPWPRAQVRDKSGVNVLLSDRYWQFRPDGQDLFEALRSQFESDEACEEVVRRVQFGGRGQKYNGLLPGDFDYVLRWLENIDADRKPSLKREQPNAAKPQRTKAVRCAG